MTEEKAPYIVTVSDETDESLQAGSRIYKLFTQGTITLYAISVQDLPQIMRAISVLGSNYKTFVSFVGSTINKPDATIYIDNKQAFIPSLVTARRAFFNILLENGLTECRTNSGIFNEIKFVFK
jgi:hypothetical protein